MKFFLRILLIVMVLLFSLSSIIRAEAAQPKKQIDIKINGIGGKALKNIQSRLELKQDLIYTQQPNIVKWRYYLEIPKEVKAAISPFGYFKAKVKTTLIRDKGIWAITVMINPGPRLRFTKVSVTVTGQGENDKAFKNFLANLPTKEGKFFNSTKYEKVKDTLQDIANARGYFKAEFNESKLQVNLINNTSEVRIAFNTGPRFRFGKTHFSETPLKTSLLSRYITYLPGQYYNNRKLDRSRNNLSSSNYFQQVVMIPQINAERNLVVPIKTHLTMQDQVVYSLGAGYGTETGVRALASMDLRWLNSSGHSLQVLLRGAQYNNTAAASYQIPGNKPAHEFYTISAGYSQLNQVTGTGQNLHGGINYQNLFGNWRFSGGVNYVTEKYKLYNYPVPNVTFNNNAQLLYPRINLQRVYAKKNILNPKYGYNLAFTAAVGAKDLGSQTSFAQVRLDTKFLYTLPTNTRIVPRASLGYTSVPNVQNLPLSMQFYAGGFSTVRGFQFNQIGPGRVLAVGSFELQQKIYGNFYLAGFIDAGTVTDTTPTDGSVPLIPNIPLSQQKFNVGSGPAIVYLSPVGAVEVSVAKVLSASNNPTNNLTGLIGRWVVQFGLGVLL